MGWSSRPLQHALPPSLRFPRIITLTGIAWIFCAGHHLNSTNGSVTVIVGAETKGAYKYGMKKVTVAIPKCLQIYTPNQSALVRSMYISYVVIITSIVCIVSVCACAVVISMVI